MAINETLTINVDDNGSIDKLDAKGKKLSSTLRGAAAAMQQAGRTPSPVADAKFAAQSQLGQESSTARGIGGITGAAGRDFAAQAQGLGGVVRLYATFAANIFAASAAFSALSKAADTTNMIKGLDQLGAASGRNLGQLSKSLVAATDGAVSLREAMEAVTKGSSSGLTSDQILRIANSAKAASQALGLNMPDALSRLSRGISKLEPELLDELGIFVRIDKATQDYALSLGKTASSLTEFERRQAFATAVLAQAEEKFGNIKIDSNPYAKLLASLANISQSGLEVVNKVLGPLAKVLSESPVGLSIAIAAVGKALLSQAIPAITTWRKQVVIAAVDARKKLEEVSSSFDDNFIDKTAVRLNLPQLEKDLQAAEALKQKYTVGADKKLYNTRYFQDAVFNNDPSRLNRAITSKQSLIDSGSASKEVLDRNAKQLVQLKQLQGALLATAKAQEALNAAEEVQQKILNQQGFSDKVRQTRLDQARAKAGRLEVLSEVSSNVNKLGFSDAISKLNQDINDKGLKGLNKFRTLASGTMAAVTTSVGNTLSAFSSLFGYLAVGAVVFQGLDYWLSKNAESVGKFNSSLEELNSSVSLVKDTIENFQTANFDKALSVEAITAKANSIEELASGMSKLTKNLSLADAQASDWDNFIDGFFIPFGADLKSKFSKTMSIAIAEGVNGIQDGDARKELEEKLNGVLGTTELSVNSLNKAFDKITPDKIVGVGRTVAEAFKQANEQSKTAAKSLTDLSTSFSALGRAYDQSIQSLKPSDDISKLGSAFITASQDITEAFKNPLNAVVALKDIISDASKLRFFDEETQKNLINSSALITDLRDRLANVNIQIQQANKNVAAARSAPVTGTGRGFSNQNAAKNQNIANNEAVLKAALLNKSTIEGQINKLASEFKNLSVEALGKGIMLLERSLTAARAQSAITISRAVVSGMSGIGTSEINNILKQKELDIQLQTISITETLNNTMIRANILSEQRLVQDKLKTSTERLESGRGGLDSGELLKEIQGLENLDKALTKVTGILDSGSSIVSAFAKLSPEEQRVARPAYESGLQSATQRAGIIAQKKAGNIEARQGTDRELAAIAQRRLQYESDIQSVETDRLKLLTSIGSINSLELIKLKQQAEILVENKNSEKALQLLKDKEIAQQKVINSLSDKDEKEAAQNSLNDIKLEITQAEKLRDVRKELADLNRFAEQERNKLSNKQSELEFENKLFQTRQELNSASIDYRKSELEFLNNIKGISAAYYAEEISNIEKESALLERNKVIKEAEFDKAGALATLGTDTTIRLAAAGTNETARQEVLNSQAEQESRINQIYSNRSVIADRLYANKLANIEASKIEADIAANITDNAQALSVIFGDLGNSIDQVILGLYESLAKGSVAMGKLNEEIQALQAIRNSSEASDGDKEKALKDENRLLGQKSKLENKITLDAISGTKKLFKEKTAAHKAFATLEKVTAAISMATQIQQFALTLSTLPATIGKGVAKLFEQGGWAGFAGAAAFLALMGSLGFSGSSSVPQAGNTAEDRQQSQGTGQSWVNGRLQDNGGGVFGDSSAKSESIKNSLEIIRDNTIEGLGYDSRMLKALESIDKSIGSTARTLYSVTGLRSGSLTGRAELSTSTSGITGLFGKSTSKQIIDSGIILSGTFGQLAESADGLVRAYETVRTTTKKSGFLGIGASTKVKDTTTFISVSDDVESEISAIFRNAQDLFVQAGDRLGMSAESVISKLNTINIGQAFASLRGLKGEELEKEFSAVIGNLLDSASTTLFSELERFRQFGEGMLETVVRVVDSNDKVKVALDSISNITTAISYDVSEALLESSDGLEGFTKQLNFFTDNFLTEAERLAPITDNVTSKMSELGLSFVDTREEFKAVIKGLDLTTESGRSLYQELMNIAPAFAEVYPQLVRSASAEELRNSRLQQTIEILKLQDRSGEALVLQRLNELAAMDESLRAGQIYLYALQDEATIKGKLKTAYDKETSALKTTISTIERSIKTLADFRQSLLTSDNSVLTPLQRYEETKRQAMQVAAIANGIATTDAERQAREDAINQLPTVSNAFLEASRTMFASSAQYTTDFNYVLGILGSTSSALEGQLSEAQQQLNVLQENTVLLDIIKENTQTTAELLAQYSQAQAVTASAQASYSMNLNMLTAELLSRAGLNNQLLQTMLGSIALLAPGLSFATTAANDPARSTIPRAPDIAMAYQIGGSIMAANQALVSEVQTLTAEVAALRSDQRAQTGDIIATNYDANRSVVQAVETTATDNNYLSLWYQRNQFNLA
jgi:hypothetical protein